MFEALRFYSSECDEARLGGEKRYGSNRTGEGSQAYAGRNVVLGPLVAGADGGLVGVTTLIFGKTDFLVGGRTDPSYRVPPLWSN